MLQHFLSIADQIRADAVLRRIAQHNIDSWALTGGLAIRIHSITADMKSHIRSLNDLDFITARFEDIPETLGKDFFVPTRSPRRAAWPHNDAAAGCRCPD